MFRADVLLKREVFHVGIFHGVGLTKEEARHAEADIACVVGIAEGVPLGVLRLLEDFVHLGHARQTSEGLFLLAEHGGGGTAKERALGHGGDACDFGQQFAVGVAVAEGEVGNHEAVGVAAEGVVLIAVNGLEEAGLLPVLAVLEVLQQIVLGAVEDFDADVLAEFRIVDQVPQAAPRRFQLLEVGAVEDFIHLGADLLINLGDEIVDHLLVDGQTGKIEAGGLLHDARDALAVQIAVFVVQIPAVNQRIHRAGARRRCRRLCLLGLLCHVVVSPYLFATDR